MEEGKGTAISRREQYWKYDRRWWMLGQDAAAPKDQPGPWEAGSGSQVSEDLSLSLLTQP